MVKLTRIDNNAVVEADSTYQTRDDHSRQVTLADGTICLFRPPVVKDLRELRAAGITDELESTIRLTARICIKWGDKPGITPIQLDDLEVSEFLRIQEALKDFLQTS